MKTSINMPAIQVKKWQTFGESDFCLTIASISLFQLFHRFCCSDCYHQVIRFRKWKLSLFCRSRVMEIEIQWNRDKSQHKSTKSRQKISSENNWKFEFLRKYPFEKILSKESFRGRPLLGEGVGDECPHRELLDRLHPSIRYINWIL